NFDTWPPEVSTVGASRVSAVGATYGDDITTFDYEVKSLVRVTIGEANNEAGLTGTVTITPPAGPDMGPFDTSDLGGGSYCFDWGTDGITPGVYEVRVTLRDAAFNIDSDGIDAADPDLTITLQDNASEGPTISSVKAFVGAGEISTTQVSAIVTIEVTEGDRETNLSCTAEVTGPAHPAGTPLVLILTDPDGDGVYTVDWDTHFYDADTGDYTFTVTLADA
ncbi:unnamed protein product, partial [marine sediment metagenome]